MVLFGQYLGFLGIAANVLIYQQKTQNKVLIFKLISDIIWMSHFYLIGAYSGAAVAMVGVIRELSFMLIKKHRKVLLTVFMIAAVTCCALTFKNAFSILPSIANILSVISFWQQSALTTKYMSLPISACMGIYGFASGSVSGVCNEILTVISSVISITHIKKGDRKMKTRIGVINWDSGLKNDTYFGYHTANTLGKAEFKERVPYYATRVDENSINFNDRREEDYDTELSYAIDAGIDYFAYVWYPYEGSVNSKQKDENDCDHTVYELRHAMELYFKSSLNKQIGFCAILSSHPFTDNDFYELIDKFKEPYYEKIDGRPLIYIFGGCRNETVLHLKALCKEKGVSEPYAVAMLNYVSGNEKFDGIDALCAYATCKGSVTKYSEHITDVLKINDQRRAAHNIIPFFSLGWSPKPRILTKVPWIEYKDVDYANSPSGEEIFEQGKRFFEYVRENKRENDPNHILVFAWNEFEEGGWLCPVMSDEGIDDSKIKAFKKVSDYLRKNL